jgi:hypothetical protein
MPCEALNCLARLMDACTTAQLEETEESHERALRVLRRNMFLRTSSLPSLGRGPLNPSSSPPRTPRARSGCLRVVLFSGAALLLLAVLCAFVAQVFIPRVFCTSKGKDNCIGTGASVFQGVLYNHYAIQRSCTPTAEGGKVVVVTGSSGKASIMVSCCSCCC